MLHTPLGRDFTLVTAVGVEFKVHSQWLLGESAALEEYLHPGGVSATSQVFGGVHVLTYK
jgi:hypothetical protein